MPSSNRSNQNIPSAGRENRKMQDAPVQRPQAYNQQIGMAVRPQLPRDATSGQTRWQPGELPMGGFRAVIDFSGTPSYNTKKSPTSGGGKKVY
jgi:hypothetical protein